VKWVNSILQGTTAKLLRRVRQAHGALIEKHVRDPLTQELEHLDFDIAQIQRRAKRVRHMVDTLE
jgi:hypothetical protein